MLLQHHTIGHIEIGCDEAGRGCLAGPVYAAAVMLPDDYRNDTLNDSKQLTERKRYLLREEIERDAVAWAVAFVDNEGIDQTNILRASFHAMNLAINQILEKVQTDKRIPTPQALIIDGNRFYNETPLPYTCIVKGDAKYLSIAAASILAKTYRDDFMLEAHKKYPDYGWDRNKGYPTQQHYDAIEQHGITPLHRKSYRLERQLTLEF